MADVPEKLSPYIFLGIDLNWSSSSKEALGDCPFCGREGKFSIEIESGKYRCLSCSDGKKGQGQGNISIFLNHLLDISHAQTTDYSDLLEKKLFWRDETLASWNVCKSSITGDWLIPGYNAEAKLQQLYKLSRVKKGDAWRDVLLPTPTLNHKLHGVNLYKKNCEEVYLCEGPWDAIALWEMFSRTKIVDEELQLTSSNKRNLLENANILGVPGANVFFESWIPLFAGKNVFLCYDNDRFRKNPKTGKRIKPAGLEGMKRVARILSSSPTPPLRIMMKKWKIANDKIGAEFRQ